MSCWKLVDLAHPWTPGHLDLGGVGRPFPLLDSVHEREERVQVVSWARDAVKRKPIALKLFFSVFHWLGRATLSIVHFLLVPFIFVSCVEWRCWLGRACFHICPVFLEVLRHWRRSWLGRLCHVTIDSHHASQISTWREAIVLVGTVVSSSATYWNHC